MTIELSPDRTATDTGRLRLPEPRLRDRLSELYLDYVEMLDECRFDEWLDLFATIASYLAVSDENYRLGLPIATIRCDSRGMIADRLHAIRNTAMFEPRTMRHIVGGVRVRAASPGRLLTEASFVVVRILTEGSTELFSSGRYRDVVVEQDGRMMFAEKVAVYDGALIANSLVYPL